MNVIWPGGIGSYCILGQAEHSMEVIFETLRGEAGKRFHYSLEIPEGVKEKGRECQVLLDLQTAGDRKTGVLRNKKCEARV